MKQRFGIAQALIASPKLIIVDEPTAGLDPAERNRFLNLLSELGENTIVILSTHIVEDVKELCSDMAIINRGQVLYKGNPFDAMAQLEGKVWQKRITKAELNTYKEHFTVISDRLIAGTCYQCAGRYSARSWFCSCKSRFGGCVFRENICQRLTYSNYAFRIY
jgi:ABC-type multidrug transport system ATPase subunit